ncbi:MAG: hypothetical protein ACKO04_05155, partial [Actinomycetes bacterium]
MNALITLVSQTEPLISPAPISENTSGGAAGALLGLVVGLAIVAVMLIAYWKLFVKMQEPGWHGIIP